MGLTISYNFEFRGSKRALAEKLSALKTRCEDLPVTSVSKVVEIKRASIEFGYRFAIAHTDNRTHEITGIVLIYILN